MDSFTVFQKAVQDRFKAMCAASDHIFSLKILKDDLWYVYLESFMPGTNPIFRERTEHDCQCCRQFINHFGGLVIIKNSKRMSLWDLPELAGTIYEPVAKAMHAFVMKCQIDNIFFGECNELGIAKNFETEGSNIIATWNHFAINLPDKYLFANKHNGGKTLSSHLSYTRASHDVFKRSMREITIEAIDKTIELAQEKLLYRADDKLTELRNFRDNLILTATVPRKYLRDHYWQTSAILGGGARLRNSAIGTFLVDLSNDVPMETAVKKYEKITAPENYKRPKAIFTKKMLDNAKEALEKMGYLTALPRRYAVMDDITINNVIFANRDVKAAMDVFEELSGTIPINNHETESTDITLDDFLKNYVPNSTRIELLLENKHCDNMMSLTAPKDADSKSMFKWDNGFSWAYVGDVADSIKARVKMAGGDIEGVLRCSLAWFNSDDLDIHIKEPDGTHINFNHKRNSRTTCKLDVDMNASNINSVDPVENITWSIESRMLEGKYDLFVHQYTKRSNNNPGFEIEIEYAGEVFTHTHADMLRQGQTVPVTSFQYSKDTGIEILSSLKSKNRAKEVWGISTMNFHDVKMIMHSPNHWDANGSGNKHYFFMLKGCINPDQCRGFFNEFLNEELQPHRRVLEALGAKMMAYPDDNQLSGVGFSSTRRNEVVCRVHSGDTIQTVNIQF